MPESRLERNSAAVSVGDVSVSIDPYDTGEQNTDYLAFTDTDSPVSIAAGKYKVTVYNEGFQNLTVNGDIVPSGNTWTAEAFSNPNTQKLDLTPAITITIPSGGRGSYTWVGPSS